MSFLSPIGFCERIKTIYWDSRKRFKMCLSSVFLLLCLSLLFPLPFTAFVASLTRGYNYTCQPSFSKEYPLSLSLITCFPTVAHSDQALFQSILPSQPNKNISSLKVYPTRASLASRYIPLKGILTQCRASPDVSLLTLQSHWDAGAGPEQGGSCNTWCLGHLWMIPNLT